MWLLLAVYLSLLTWDVAGGAALWDVIAGERDYLRHAWQMVFLGPEEDPFMSIVSVVGLVVSVMLLLTYAALIAVQLARGKTDVRCGCAGLDSTMTISKPIVLRNVICAVLAVLCLSPSGAAPTSFAGVGLSIYVALFLIILYLCSDQLANNAQRMAGEV